MITDNREAQVVWVFGALERLSNLGFIGGFGYHVRNVDDFIEIDERRSTLFASDEDMSALVSIVCRKECGLTALRDIGAVIHLVKCYRDHGTAVLQFALEGICSNS